MKYIIVYTVITNDYDELQTVTPEEGVRYVLFTDQPDKPEYQNKGWEIRSIFDEGWSKENRWYKWHSNELFPHVEATIYIDAHGKLLDTPKNIVERVKTQDCLMAFQLHQTRTCVYEEWAVCDKLGLVHDLNCLENLIKGMRYPDYNGLYANGCIVRIPCKITKNFEENVYHISVMFDVWRDQLIAKPVIYFSRIQDAILETELFTWGKHKR